ncbi:hypothetical protein EB118_18135 [bacterium]|nr:hypothetical protein [bacterium]NDC95846.1 hypothetical protein [bacterium]NDD85529.1 hypothetical protein [bacterium]NDG31979.1 hypothetical protein [bacterium]
MKYLEELVPGSIFLYNNNKYFLSADFKINKSQTKKLCLNFENGYSQWLDANTMVDLLDLYYRDIDGNILSLKEFKQNDQTISS